MSWRLNIFKCDKTAAKKLKDDIVTFRLDCLANRKKKLFGDCVGIVEKKHVSFLIKTDNCENNSWNPTSAVAAVSLSMNVC